MASGTAETTLLLVTGPSGAGHRTAIPARGDLGYELIDNLPLSLIPRPIEGPAHGRPLALGLDVRNRDLTATALIELINALTRGPRVSPEVLYLACAPEVLIRRFSQTRRRPPLADTPDEDIARAIDLLAPIRMRADHVIDTTEMSPHDQKAESGGWYGGRSAQRLAVSVQSFSYKRGVPRGLDMVFDGRFLKNPYWSPELRALDGRDPTVAAHIAGDSRLAPFLRRLQGLTLFLLPARLDEGKAHRTIGFGCTGGQHRSVAVAEKLGNVHAETGWPVTLRHRELERRAAGTPGPGTG